MNMKSYALFVISILGIALLSSAYPSLYEKATAQEEEEKERTEAKCSPESDEDFSEQQQCVPEKGNCPSDDTLIIDQDEEGRSEFSKKHPDIIPGKKTTGIPYGDNATTGDGNHTNMSTRITGLHSNFGLPAIC